MTIPNNILQTVQTYQKAELAFMYNTRYALKHANKKFINFQNFVANLGASVTFDVSPTFISVPSLTTVNESAQQRTATLTVANAYSVSMAFTAQQFIFNDIDGYMDRFGRGAALAIGTDIEGDFMANITSSMTVNDPKSENFGFRYVDSGPYRFFGDGVTPINSFGQLSNSINQFEAIGCAQNKRHGIIPLDYVSDIVNTGLNQFAPDRNNELARDWELGIYQDTEWFKSNLTPIHLSGTIGNAASPNNVITVVSTNDPTGKNVTQITVTEPTGGTSLNAIKAGDLFQSVDQTGFTPLRQVTVNGKRTTSRPAQFVAIADAETVGGTVTITLRTVRDAGLVWAQTNKRNINTPIVAGMKFSVKPSHAAGLLHSGDQFYMAMPQLPNYDPYPYSVMFDEKLGVSLRHYYGNVLGQNTQQYVRDAIAGAYLLPDNCQRMLFPLISV